MLKMILATGINGELGCDNKLLEYIPEDLTYFKEHTLNQVVIMGRKTFDSLPFKNGLPNRTNYVLTRYGRELSDKVTTLPSINDMSRYCLDSTSEDVWVIGGASIYEQFKDLVSEIHHTQINKSYPEADCHFSMDWVKDETKFECVSEEVLCDIAKVKVYKRKG